MTTDFNNSLNTGLTLTKNKKFTEAIPYLENALPQSPENETILLNLGYCYYYTENFIYSKMMFERVLLKNPSSNIAKKYLSNIKQKLNGEHVRSIKFKSYNNYHPNYFKTIKNIVVYSFLIILCLGTVKLYTDFKDNTSKKSDTATVSKTSALKHIDEIDKYNKDKSFTNLKTADDIKNADLNCNTNVCLYVNNIHPTDYYKLKEPYKNQSVYHKEFIDNNNLTDKIESRIYLCVFSNRVISFMYNNYNDSLLDKDGGFFIKGTLCHIDENIYYDLRNSASGKSYQSQWLKTAAIDTSENVINETKRNLATISYVNGRQIKTPCDIKDYEISKFAGLFSLTLTNVKAIDFYAVLREDGTVGLYNKSAMNSNNLWDKLYSKCYVGTFDNHNIMFIDPEFNLNSSASNKYTITGYAHNFISDNSEESIPLNEQGAKIIVSHRFLCSE